MCFQTLNVTLFGGSASRGARLGSCYIPWSFNKGEIWLLFLLFHCSLNIRIIGKKQLFISSFSY